MEVILFVCGVKKFWGPFYVENHAYLDMASLRSDFFAPKISVARNMTFRRARRLKFLGNTLLALKNETSKFQLPSVLGSWVTKVKDRV